MNRYAFYDLDGTIVNCNTEIEFSKYLVRNMYKNNNFLVYIMIIIFINLTIIKHKLNFTNYSSNYAMYKREIIKNFYKGKSIDECNAVFRELFNETLKNCIFSEIKKKIAEQKKSNIKVCIISASFDFMVKHYCEYLDVDQFYATTLEESENGFYTGNVIGDIYYGKTKGEIINDIAITENIHLDKSFAYGDHISDQYMLKIVGFPNVINPDNKLKKLAKENKWRIDYYKK